MAFGESASRYVLQLTPEAPDPASLGVPAVTIGMVTETGSLTASDMGIDGSVEELAAAWVGPLDW